MVRGDEVVSTPRKQMKTIKFPRTLWESTAVPSNNVVLAGEAHSLQLEQILFFFSFENLIKIIDQLLWILQVILVFFSVLLNLWYLSFSLQISLLSLFHFSERRKRERMRKY